MSGDARVYQLGLLEDDGGGRREAELGLFRLKLEARPADELSLDAHGLLEATSPAAPAGVSIATGRTRHLLDLDVTLLDDADLRVTAGLDRLSATWQRPAFRLIVGRQAITWGVSTVWPVLDLFAPFPPERIDREYKPGVDAVRLTVPVGRLSEVDLVAAGQGTSLERDGSLGGLARLHLGAADVGIAGGRFHRDTVAGGFVTADVRGTGLRGEAAWTDSGDPADAGFGRAHFWRASAGLDRQLTPTVSLTVEVAWNGFGASRVADYPRVVASDRARRGEVTSLGRYQAGLSVGWQLHPLVVATGAVLANLDDGSTLWLPHLDWLLRDDLVLVLGGVFGLGPGRSATGPGSEYGGVPAILYAALKAYF